MQQYFKVQNAMTNVKEFREEDSTLNHDHFVSKNLDHLKSFILALSIEYLIYKAFNS